MRRWLPFALLVAVMYGTLGVAPMVGRAVLATAVGAWSFGRGLPIVVLAVGAGLVWHLARRQAPLSAYGLLALALIGYAGGLLWLRTQRLERVHLPEYGVLAWLGWRALVPTLGDGAKAYAAAAVLAAVVGWGEEIVQGFVPGRVYDLRDVGANALAAVLGTLLVASLRLGSTRQSNGGS